MELIYDGETMPQGEFINIFKDATQKCLDYENVLNRDLELSVTFVSLEEIREINMEHRGIDKPTDVLSFPQFEGPEDIPPKGVYALGDVVICLDKAKDQAADFGHSLDRELVYLFVHSVFHLLGHDHLVEDQKSIMRKGEETVMSDLGLERTI